MKLPPLPGRTASAAVGLASSDEHRALSVLSSAPKKGRRRRCATCGLVFAQGEVRAEVDEDGRTVGWTCFGCE